MSQASVWRRDLTASRDEGRSTGTKQQRGQSHDSGFTAVPSRHEHTTRLQARTIDPPRLSIKRTMSSFFSLVCESRVLYWLAFINLFLLWGTGELHWYPIYL